MQVTHFIDSCGYKDDLVKYVFEAIAYGIGLQLSSEEPSITPDIDVDSFFDIPKETPEQPSPNSDNANTNQNVNPSDLYSIALTFFNEGKYAQAKSFIEKSISLFPNSNVPSIQLKLKGDINMKLGNFAEAIIDYNNCFARRSAETNIILDEIREQLKEHKIKGYENSMFCYYFCLYSLGKMNKDQWLKLVKAEAMSGINDAICFCAGNGINPMESHVDIYFIDKDMLRTGDYLYSDGTFAHELSSDKKVIARVIITETTEYEKSQGWTHGYLFPVNQVSSGYLPANSTIYKSDFLMWSTSNEDLPFPHSHYTIDDINHWSEIKTIESEHYISIKNFDNFPAFKAVNDFPVNIPLSGASKWFLPSIHWHKRCRLVFFRFTGRFWTSSQADSSKAIFVEYKALSYKKGSIFYTDNYSLAGKNATMQVLPISAF